MGADLLNLGDAFELFSDWNIEHGGSLHHCAATYHTACEAMLARACHIGGVHELTARDLLDWSDKLAA